MNIFFDTSILYSNPFLRGNFYSRLLEVVKNERATLFISDVVLKELRHNLEKIYDKDAYDLNKINSSLSNNLGRLQEFEMPNKDECLSNFDNFYSNLKTNYGLKILKYSDELLTPILERAIKREKPFTEKKTELKDALIWLTYANYVNDNGLDDCFLLTNNTSDFCDLDKLKKGEFELHPDLKKDCDKFRVFITIKDFYQGNSNYLDKPQKEFEEWIRNNEFDDKIIFELLFEHEGGSIEEKIYDLTDKIDPDNLFDRGYLVSMGGYMEIGEIELYECKDTDVEIVSDYAIISGIVTARAEVEGYGYNSFRDRGDEKYPYIGSSDIEVEVYFTFTIEKDGMPEDFEITDVEVV